jgi:hypothetical protein
MCSASSRCPDVGVARARQLRGRCRQLAPALPTGHHVHSTCDACSCRPMRHLVALSVRRRSRLSSSRDSRRTPAHSTLLSPSASAPSSPHSFAPSVKVPTNPHRSCAPLSHAKLTVEPPSAVRNRRSTEPAASFGCGDHLPVKRHRRAPPSPQRPPPELTAAPQTLSRRSPPLLCPAVASSPPPICFAAMSPPR